MARAAARRDPGRRDGDRRAHAVGDHDLLAQRELIGRQAVVLQDGLRVRVVPGRHRDDGVALLGGVQDAIHGRDEQLLAHVQLVLGGQLVGPPDGHHVEAEVTGDAGQRVARLDHVDLGLEAGRRRRHGIRREQGAVRAVVARPGGLLVAEAGQLRRARRVGRARVGGDGGGGAEVRGGLKVRDVGVGRVTGAGRAADRRPGGGQGGCQAGHQDERQHHHGRKAPVGAQADEGGPGRHEVRQAPATTDRGAQRPGARRPQRVVETDTQPVQVVAQAGTRMPDGDRCLKQYGLLWGPGVGRVAGKGTGSRSARRERYGAGASLPLWPRSTRLSLPLLRASVDGPKVPEDRDDRQIAPRGPDLSARPSTPRPAPRPAGATRRG